MKLQDATGLYVGSSTASKAYIGTTQVWPNNALQAPGEVQYNVIKQSGWGQHYIVDGGQYTLTGSYYFGSIDTPGGYAWNTYQYDWIYSGDVTLIATEFDLDNKPYLYRFDFDGGPATLTISDPNNPSRVFVTATFNS